jgi:bifunctional UDP-N-acetylglucosamine pyrophosphorylase/glucosamine-1-phosphate N-acetyltransferase
MSVCAVVPAAGRGTRLGLTIPKILTPIGEDVTVWSILRENLIPTVDRVVVVLSPSAVPLFERALASDPAKDRISFVVQPRAVGMGDAIFTASPVWQDFESILTLWGDQVHVSASTIRAALADHARHGGCTIPVVRISTPYVQYDLDGAGRLCRVRQTREGDRVDPDGFNDVGLFVLSTEGLHAAWRDYLLEGPIGPVTNEVNFLPFLVFLSSRNWPIRLLPVPDAVEALGINTPADLAEARRRFALGKPLPQGLATEPVHL